MARVVLAVNAAWNVANFRAGLVRAMVAAGHEVVVVAPPDSHVPAVRSLGCRYIPFPMDNQGTHPGRDLHLFWRFLRLLRELRPDLYLGYTVKPNVYGSLAARLLHIPVINNISGLGAVFINTGWVTRVVRGAYRLALVRSKTVFFQNGDDRHQFVSERIVPQSVTAILPGSGIDLAHFVPVPPPSVPPFRFLMVARMLRDKGVEEYVEAARMLRLRGIQVQCCLLGMVDAPNPAAISGAQMEAWVAEGVVSYLGVRDDVRPEVAKSHCVVLPSYREGTPRTLLEAAAMARPIVATEVEGCREVVDNGLNGFLCAPRDPVDLAEKMAAMAALSEEQRESMGRNGRAKVEQRFDEKIVIERYLDAISRIVQGV